MSETKNKMLTLRLTEKDVEMIQVLKSSPYYVNISEYLRNSLEHLYHSRIKDKSKATIPPDPVIKEEIKA